MVKNGDFGRQIGVSKSMASRIRNGKRLPGTGTIYELHRELGIPLADLHAAHARGPAAMGRLVSDVLAQKKQAA